MPFLNHLKRIILRVAGQKDKIHHGGPEPRAVSIWVTGHHLYTLPPQWAVLAVGTQGQQLPLVVGPLESTRIYILVLQMQKATSDGVVETHVINQKQLNRTQSLLPF